MKIEYKGKNYNLPDFLIVGAAKSGTTSLHYYLKNEKEIFLPEIKESYFFSFYNNKPNFKSPDPLFDVISDIDVYNKQFPEHFEGFIGDASPSYLYSHEETIRNLKTIYKDKYKKIKIIIILRNPIERAWSQYMHFKKNYNEPLEFDQAIKENIINYRLNNQWNYFYDYIGFGNYFEQVKSYMDHFDNVKIFLFDDLKKHTVKTVSETLNFLGTNKIHYKNSESKVFNISGIPKKNIFSLFWRLKRIRIAKKIFRKILPAKIRNAINNFLLSRSLKRVLINEGSRKTLNNIYKNELNKLYDLLKREEIKKWN